MWSDEKKPGDIVSTLLIVIVIGFVGLVLYLRYLKHPHNVALYYALISLFIVGAIFAALYLTKRVEHRGIELLRTWLNSF